MLLTELEGTVIGLLTQAPAGLTAYAVKELLRASPSRVWSGSAGAVYPLLTRLEGRGLVAARDATEGAKRRTLFIPTAAGRQALRDWLGDAERAADLGSDPMRLRLAFADLMAEDELADLLDGLAVRLAQDSAVPPSRDPRMAAMHAAWVKHRRAAFEEVRAILMADRPDDAA